MSDHGSMMFPLSVLAQLESNCFEQMLAQDEPIQASFGYIFSKYDDISTVLRSKEFGRTYWFGMEFVHGPRVHEQYAFQVMSDWLVELNPPEHTRMRKLMQRSFGSAHIDSLRRDIELIADQLITRIKKKGAFDLVKDFAFPLPVLVICRMLGIPADDYEMFIREPLLPSNIVDPVPFDQSTMSLANERFYFLRDYFLPLFEERKKNPRDDLISMLVREHVDGDTLSAAELLSNVLLLFFAGHETTANLIAAGLRELYLYPSQLALLKRDFSLTENAVYEMLRLVSVAQMTLYTALDDVTAPVPMNRSMGACCIIAAGNRDPRVFADPNVLNITRDNAKKHLALGGGIHYCLGGHLARIEACVAIEKLLTAFPRLQLLDLDKPVWRPSLALRGLETQCAIIE